MYFLHFLEIRESTGAMIYFALLGFFYLFWLTESLYSSYHDLSFF